MPRSMDITTLLLSDASGRQTVAGVPFLVKEVVEGRGSKEVVNGVTAEEGLRTALGGIRVLDEQVRELQKRRIEL